MKIATYNVNSIRRRLPIVLDWLGRHQPDVLCLQETKVQDELFPTLELESAGYQVAFRGMKSYNGVATLSRERAEQVEYGLCAGPDSEDTRILRAMISGIAVVNTYVPQGKKVGSENYARKLEWFKRLREYFTADLGTNRPIIWLGDVNVAPEPIDVYHPDRRGNDPDFHLDARNAYQETVSRGFTDVFRKLHPERIQYTYWDYFRNAFENNWGWRIDHILVTEPLVSRCRICEVDVEPRKAEGASDHTVVWAEFDWP
jgi:exodeoxyribonuclease III